jgi:hypothetical protein
MENVVREGSKKSKESGRTLSLLIMRVSSTIERSAT